MPIPRSHDTEKVPFYTREVQDVHSCLVFLLTLLDWTIQMRNVLQAGLVTTLNTRTTVFGVTNPKGQYDPFQSIHSTFLEYLCHQSVLVFPNTRKVQVVERLHLIVGRFVSQALCMGNSLTCHSSICEHNIICTTFKPIWHCTGPFRHQESWVGQNCLISHLVGGKSMTWSLFLYALFWTFSFPCSSNCSYPVLVGHH